MEHKTALGILVQMIERRDLTDAEKEAVLTAIGVLSWTKLAKSRVRSIAAKRKVRQDTV